MSLDWSKARYPLYEHQKQGVKVLVDKPVFALFDQVGAGKTAQVVFAACQLYTEGQIDAVIVICPASVRSVWVDPDPILGEVTKHAWLPIGLLEYHRKTARLPKYQDRLWCVATNFEFLRRAERLEPLIDWARGRKVLLVLDESWAIKNWKSQQSKAVRKLRAACSRVVILNGTPGDPGNIFSQFLALDPDIIGCKNWFVFRARYARMGGYMAKQIVEWVNQEEFQRRIAPYALRRMTHECVDLPPVSYTTIDARLTPETWRHYVAMRDEQVTWLSENEVCTAAQAGVRVLRLAQITAGFLGGVEQSCPDDLFTGAPPSPVREIGREKLDALLEWLAEHWAGDKALIFTRFRADVERAATVLQSVYASTMVAKLYGGQKPAEREVAKRLLAPGGDPAAAIVVGNAASGGAGLNFAASNLCVFLANDFSLKTRLQAEGRVDRPGQTRHVTYVDVVASGPNGEHTVDHTIVRALRQKQDLSKMTAAAWRDVLRREGHESVADHRHAA